MPGYPPRRPGQEGTENAPDGDQLVSATHKGLKRVDTKGGLPEKSYTDSANQHIQRGHEASAFYHGSITGAPGSPQIRESFPGSG